MERARKPLGVCSHGVPSVACYHKECHTPPPSPSLLEEEAEEKELGRKDDSNKPRYDLIPPEMLDGLTKVLTFGAEKYASRNWENGIEYGRVFAAAQRHLWAWWGGCALDEETGLSHLSHALCCITFLSTYEARNMGEQFDDRKGDN